MKLQHKVNNVLEVLTQAMNSLRNLNAAFEDFVGEADKLEDAMRDFSRVVKDFLEEQERIRDNLLK